MHKLVRSAIPTLALLIALAPAALAQDALLIRNARIVPVTGRSIPRGCILVRKGRIEAIGEDLAAPPGAVIVDASGLVAYPGLIAPLTTIGLTGYPGAGDDVDEVGVSTPQMDPFDALNPEDPSIEVTRLGGVTTVLSAAGTHNVINGKALVLNLDGELAEDLVLKRDAAQVFNLGARQQGKYPTTLPGIMALIRDKLERARRFLEFPRSRDPEAGEGKRAREKRPEEPPPYDPESEALAPVVTGRIPALFLTYNEATIHNALELIKEFRLKGILYATTDVMKYAGRLRAEGTPVIWAGTTKVPERWEAFDVQYREAGRLGAAGLAFAFDQTGGWIAMNRNTRNLPVTAALSIAHGLSEEEAIEALTIAPARILGVDAQVGSLEIGKTANIVLWNGSPVQMSSRVEKIIINGRLIPLESLQTRLRDRFSKMVKDRITKKGSSGAAR